MAQACFCERGRCAVEYPVCLADSCVGTLYVCPRGEETELRAVCRGSEKGLYRLYVQGNRGEVLLLSLIHISEATRPY